VEFLFFKSSCTVGQLAEKGVPQSLKKKTLPIRHAFLLGRCENFPEIKILPLYCCVYLSEIVLLSSLKSSCNSVLCYLILNVVIRAKQYIWNACMHILKAFRFKFGMCRATVSSKYKNRELHAILRC